MVQVVKQVFQKPADVLSTEVYDVLLRGELGYHSASPIFVVGMPRSGSTLVEQMLSSHPQACGAGIAALCCVLCCASLDCAACCAVLCAGLRLNLLSSTCCTHSACRCTAIAMKASSTAT